MNNFTGIREIAAGEIRPERSEHSGTKDDNEEKNSISHASDLDLTTRSGTVDRTGGTEVWLKFYLGRVHCVEQLKRWNSTREIRNTWTCTNDNCNNCEGSSCSNFTYDVTVEIEETETQTELYSFPDCKYGDTVKLEIINGSGTMYVWEVAVIAKQGERLLNISTFDPYWLITFVELIHFCD